MTATRFRAALTTLGRPAASLAPELGCSPRLTQNWLHGDGPPAEVLAWVEGMAAACVAVPVPVVRFVAGRKPAG